MFNFTKNKEVQQQEFKPLFYINPRPQVADLPEIKEKEKIDIKYVLIEPYVYAHIFWDKENNELVYNIEEPELDEKEAGILNLLENSINELINISFIGMKSTDVVIEYLEKNLRVLLSELKINITKESFLKLMYYIYRDFVGLNELEPLLRDYYIEDIECNGVNTPIYIVHRKYRNIRTNVIFRDIRKLTSFVEKVAQKCGKYISYASPLLDASLPDGSVDYEEPIIYKENGIVKISKIGEFVDKFYKDKESNKPISINDIEVPAFDNKTLKISWKKVDYVYRHKTDDDLLELELEFGRKIKLTKYHSIFVLTKEGVKAKKTEEIKESDIVVAPLTIPENNIIKEINVAKELSKIGYTNLFTQDNKRNEFMAGIPISIFNPVNHSDSKFKNKRMNRKRIKKIIDNIRTKINHNHPAFIHEWTKKGFLNANKPTNKFYELMKEFDIITKIAESDLGFFKINSIKKVKSSSEFVYDLSVKDHENFISGTGGVCCHNSRVNATYTQDISTKGPAVTIRKFTSEPWSPIKLMQFKTLSPEMLSYLWLAIEHESNIMVIGGTGSGKTSLLNSIAFFIPPASRVVTIEDTRELNILHENWLPGVTRSGIGASNLLGTKEGEITLFDLLRESFRQRPDYLIVGEIRGREAYVLFQGMSSLRGDEEIFILRDDKPLRIKIKDLEKEDVSRLKAISYDVVNKKMEILPIKAFVRHPMRNKLYNIKTRFGREITVTPDHSLFTLDKNGKIIDIKTEEFKIGSKIIIPSTIPCGYNNIADLDLFEYLPDIRVFAPDYIKEASNKIGYYEASSLCNCASITDYYSDFKRNRSSAMKAEKFLKLMKEAEVNFDVNKIEFRYDKKSKSIKGNLEISDEFLRLLGYYISEGSLDQGGGNSRIQLYNKNEKVLEDMRKCIEKITGIKPEERITEGYGSCLELSFNHKVLFEFIKRYCKTKTEKRIPDFIFGLDKRRIGEFLSGLYCGDGTIDQKYFGYYTTSKNLANDVSQLLLVYGIITRISKRNMEGRKTTDYELIFYNSYKKEEFYKYVKPIGKEIELKLFKKTDFKLFGDLYCDEVKSIEIFDLEKPEYVYDISVPGNQNFIGGFGAVLLHNSGHPSFGTMHAEDVETMVRRLATPPIELSPSLIESLDIVCIIGPAKVNNKEVRRVKKVVEIVKVKEGSEGVETNSPFVWDPRTDNFYFKEESKVFDKIMLHKGISKEKLFKEFTLRTKLLVALYKNNIMGFKEVNDVINAYYKTPEAILKKFNIS